MLGRRSFLIFITTMLSTGISFISLLFIVNYLGAVIYGSFLTALAIITTFNSLSDLGFSQAHIKRISEGKDIGECVSTYLTVRLILTGAMVIILFISLLAWDKFLEGGIDTKELETFILLAIYIALNNITMVLVYTFTALTQSAKSQLLTMIIPFILLPMILFVCIYSPNQQSLAIAYAVAGATQLGIALTLFRRERYPISRPTLIHSYWIFAAPLAAITIISIASANVDKILIGLFNVSDVAYYGTSQTLVSVMAMMSASVTTLTFPTFSKLHSKGDVKTIREMTMKAERYIMMISLPLAIIFIVFPEMVVVTIFGPTWSAAASPLRFLSLAMLSELLNNIYGSQILAVNRPDIAAKMSALYIAVCVSLMIILIPPELFGVKLFGLLATGAAIALLIGSLVHLILNRLIISELTGTKTNWRIALHIVAAVLTGTILYLISMELPSTGLLVLAILLVLSYLIFALILFLLKELHKDDIKYLLDVVNLRKMGSYINQELSGKDDKGQGR